MSISKHQNNAGRSALRFVQRGVAMPLVVVGLLALLAVAGLALDSSHAFANKTRLQNSVDAAALAAAKVLSLPSDTAQATAAANNLLGQNADGRGNHELNDAYDAGEISVTVQFSETSNPFTPGALQGPYVRVIAQNFNIGTTLSRVLGIDNIPVTASAVAGPSPTINICDIAPIVVCADDPEDPYFGFVQDELRVLDNEAGNHEDIGPGNYQYLRLGCESGGGGSCLRQKMAGGVDQCAAEEGTVETEPGQNQGPVVQGFNTRFGMYSGGGVNPEDYPPDVVVTEPSPPLDWHDEAGEDVITQNGNEVLLGGDINYSYADYLHDSQNGPHQFPPPAGAYGRRVMAFPVAHCTGDQSGQSTLQVEGFACFFMLQSLQSGGGNTVRIFGQFVDSCLSSGVPGPDPNDAQGPFRIQLYRDPDSNDS